MSDLSWLAVVFASDPLPILQALAYQGTALGLLITGSGILLQTLSSGTGRRVSLFGARLLAHCVAFIFLQFAAIELFGPEAAGTFLTATTILAALLVLHAAINLLFGRGVGDRVIADLLSSIFHLVAFVVTKRSTAFLTFRNAVFDCTT